MRPPYIIEPEKLAYWYFRLNGFLTIVNFVVHPDSGSKQRTDVDILGVRFPYRCELLLDPMEDDDIFYEVKNKPYVIIAEVKTGTCNLNGPWTEPEKRNMHRVLRAIGVFPEELVDEIARQIYEKGVFENDFAYLTLGCVGERVNNELGKRYPQIPQIPWDKIKDFVYNRFSRYREQKADHSQWDSTGRRLWECFIRYSSDKMEFSKNIEIGQYRPIQHKRQRPQN